MKNVKVGDQVPALTKHCTLTSMIAYAGLVFAEEHVQVSGETTAVSASEVSLSLKIDVIDANGAVLRPAVTPITAKVLWR
jgi:hypothetical protein